MIRKIVIIFAISFTAIMLLSLLLLPGIVKRYTVKNSKELIGRQITLDKLKVNYFTGTIRLVNFKMFEANEKETFVSFDTLLMKLKPFQLFRDELIMQRFYLSGLKTTIKQHDSTFNFDDLIAFHQTTGDTVTNADTTGSEPFKYQLSDIEFRNARFEYQNQNIGDTMIMRDLSFIIPFIGWNQEDKSEAGIRFNFEHEGYFESNVNIDPNKGDFSANIIIYRLYLEPFYKYTTDFANLGSLQGYLNTNITISGNTGVPESSIVSGVIDLFDLKTTDERQKPFIDAAHIHTRIKEINYARQLFAFDTLVLYDPYFYVEFYDTTINVLEATDYYSYFPIGDETSETPPEITPPDTSGSPLYYGFDHLQIDNGVMDLVDNTTPETFEYNLSNIEIKADSIYSSADWVHLYSTMLLNNRGKLTAEVGFYPENPMDLNVNYVITDFLLSDLNIYSRYYMGFPILYGDMYYKSDTKILRGQLSSENKLIIHNAELGEKKGGLIDLPLKFALFLLKDRHGVINLDIPVRGDLNDPNVRIGKIVWQTFKNLIVKVATAPFDFLAGLISVDPKDIQTIEYDYTDTALTDAKKRQIDLLLQLEQKKKGLGIELVYFNDINKEKEQIKIKQAGNLYLRETGNDHLSDNEGFRNFLSTKTGTDSLDITRMVDLLIDANTTDSIADMYAKYRQSSINNYLRNKSDSTTIRIFVPGAQSPHNIESLPVFQVKYAMEGEN